MVCGDNADSIDFASGALILTSSLPVFFGSSAALPGSGRAQIPTRHSAVRQRNSLGMPFTFRLLMIFLLRSLTSLLRVGHARIIESRRHFFEENILLRELVPICARTITRRPRKT